MSPSKSRIPAITTSIYNVFEECSGFELEEFDGDTTFFEMGLDSLVLTQTATHLKKEMEIEVTFRQLLEETTTVNSLAEWLDGNLPGVKFAAAAVEQAPVAEVPVLLQHQWCKSTRSGCRVTSCNVWNLLHHFKHYQWPQLLRPVTAAVVPAATSVSVPHASAPVASNVAEHIVQEQLRIMAAQLNMLSGSTVATPTPVVSTPVAVAQPAATQSPAAIAPQAEPAVNAPAKAKTPAKTKAEFGRRVRLKKPSGFQL